MKAPALYLTAAALVFHAGCAQINMQKTDLAAEEKAIREAELEWSKSAGAKDLDKLVSFYAEDGAMFAPNAPMSVGKAAIRTSWTGIMALPGLAITWAPVKVEVAKSGDLAYDHGAYDMSFTDPSGKPVKDRGKYLVVWKKQSDNSWKVAVDMFNSDLPAAPPAP